MYKLWSWQKFEFPRIKNITETCIHWLTLVSNMFTYNQVRFSPYNIHVATFNITAITLGYFGLALSFETGLCCVGFVPNKQGGRSWSGKVIFRCGWLTCMFLLKCVIAAKAVDYLGCLLLSLLNQPPCAVNAPVEPIWEVAGAALVSGFRGVAPTCLGCGCLSLHCGCVAARWHTTWFYLWPNDTRIIDG